MGLDYEIDMVNKQLEVWMQLKMIHLVRREHENQEKKRMSILSTVSESTSTSKIRGVSFFWDGDYMPPDAPCKLLAEVRIEYNTIKVYKSQK